MLNKTSHLSYLIQEAVEDAVLNLYDIAEEEETTPFPMNVKIIKETEEFNHFFYG